MYIQTVYAIYCNNSLISSVVCCVQAKEQCNISILSRARFRGEEDAEMVSEQAPDVENVELKHKNLSTFGSDQSSANKASQSAKPFVRDQKKIGRNEPCPCGSGKKYKKCHGAIEQ